ncbi:MAG TPA: RNA polymerase sigma factor [Gammaproteobacteria bacterium]|nr:RNA polymerase sigma factor [Gammaproteobacteria bacterium]
MSNKLDQALLQRFVDGDHAAFEMLFRGFEHDVYRWILRIVRDESIAEDGVVEAFWRCYRSRARFDPSRSFGAWMRRIATRVAIDLLKSTRRHRAIRGGEMEATPIEHSGSAGDASRQAQADAIVRAFDSLQSKLRVVATLALIEERTQEEIAVALGVPIYARRCRQQRLVPHGMTSGRCSWNGWPSAHVGL